MKPGHRNIRPRQAAALRHKVAATRDVFGAMSLRARWVAGTDIGTGRDWSLFALTEGKVRFDKHGRRVNIDPVPAVRES